MCVISVFQVKFTVEVISWAMNFSWITWALKENEQILIKRTEKEKAISESTVNSQQIGNTLKLEITNVLACDVTDC